MPNPSESEVLGVTHEFLLRYANDKKAGRVLPLVDYQALYPGFEAQIAAEYEGLLEAREPETVGNPPRFLETLGRYRVLSELGQGGQGVVYLAEDTQLHRKVALKVLSSRASVSKSLRSRFHREAEATSRLQHPGICTIYEAAEVDGVPFIAMQYVRGENLARKIAAARLQESESSCVVWSASAAAEDEDADDHRHIMTAVEFIEEAARAAHVAHEAGIFHRDLKPGNIIVAPDNKPVVLDFGLAHSKDDEVLTQTGDFLGTLAYAPPERVQGEAVVTEATTDVYSLGATLYECLTLRRPFEAATREALCRKILTEDASKATGHNPAIPRDLELVLETALERDPGRRYATALEFAEDLRRVRERMPIHARPTPVSLRAKRWLQRNRAIAASLATIFLLLLGGLVLTLVLLSENKSLLTIANVQALLGASQELLDRDPRVAHILALQACKRAPADNTLSRHDTISQLYSTTQAARERHVFYNRPEGISDDLTAAQLTPDGRHLVVLHHLGVARVFDADDPRDFKTVQPNPSFRSTRDDYSGSLAVSLSGKTFATSSKNGYVYLWDIAGEKRKELPHPSAVAVRDLSVHRELLAFSPTDENLLLTGCRNGLVSLWRTEKTSRVDRYHHRKAQVRHVTWSPRGTHFAAGYVDGTTLVWKLGDETPVELKRSDSAVRWVSFAPDGNLVATASIDGEVGIWNLQGELKTSFPACVGIVTSVVFSRSGLILTAGDRSAKIWDAQGNLLKILPHGIHVLMARFSPDGRRIVTATYGGTAHVWTTSGEKFAVLRGHTDSVISASFSRDGKRVVTCSWDGSARLWDVQVPGFLAHQCDQGLFSVDVSPQGEVLVGDASGVPRLLDLKELKPRRQLNRRKGVLWAARFSDDGSRVLTCGEQSDWSVLDTRHDQTHGPYSSRGRIRDGFFDPKDPKRVILITQGGVFVTDPGRPAQALSQESFDAGAVSADGTKIAAATSEHSLYVWERPWAIAKPLRVAAGSIAITALGFSPTGQRLVVGNQRGGMYLYSGDGRPLRELPGHNREVGCVRYESGGRRFLTTSADGTAKLWTNDGDLLATLRGHRGEVRDGAFSQDGRWIVTVGSDGEVRTWPAQFDHLVKLAEDRIFRPLLAKEQEPYAHLLEEEPGDRKRGGVLDVGKPAAVQASITRSRSQTIPPQPTSDPGILRDKLVRIAHQRELVATSLGVGLKNPQLSLLLACQALAIEENHDTRSAVYAAVSRAHQRDRIVPNYPGTMVVPAMRFAQLSPAGDHMITVSNAMRAFLWPRDGRQALPRQLDHGRRVLAAAFSPKGEHLVTVSFNGNAVVWNTDGKRCKTLRLGAKPFAQQFGPLRPRWPLAFAPDGRRFVTGAQDGFVRIWALDQDTWLQSRRLHNRWIQQVAWSPTGDQIATASGDGLAKVWSVDHPDRSPVELPGSPKGKNGKQRYPVDLVRFSPSGQLIATASRRTVYVWRGTGEKLFRWQVPRGRIRALAFSPDEKLLLASGANRDVWIWDLKSGARHNVLPFNGAVLTARFSPDSRAILTACADQTAYLHSVEGRELARFRGHTDAVTSASFSRAGRTVVTSSFDGTAAIWDRHVPGFEVFTGHQHTIVSAEFSSDGKQLLTGSDDFDVALWSTDTQKLVGGPNHGSGSVVDATFNRTGTRVLISRIGGVVELCDSNLRTIESKKLPAGTRAAFTNRWPDQIYVANGKGLFVWKTKSKDLRSLAPTSFAPYVAVAPGGERLAIVSGTWTNMVHVWDIQSASDGPRRGPRNDYSAPNDIHDLAFSPDGKQLALAVGDHTVRILDCTSARLIETHKLEGHTMPVFAVCFSGDGKRLLSGGGGGTAMLWDLTSGKPLVTLRGHRGRVRAVNFSPHGDRVVTAGADGTVRFWPTDFEVVKTLARARTLRDYTEVERKKYKMLLAPKPRKD